MANLIFDFDGTIANTLPLLVKLFDKWSGRPPVQQAEIDRFRDMTVREILKEIGVPLWRLPGYVIQGRQAMAQGMKEAELFPGLIPVLERLSGDGHQLFLASSNSSENIEQFLARHKAREYFESVYGNIGVFGKAKVIRSIIKLEKLKADETYYVGDEVRDIEAAKKAGVASVSVGWGYNGSIILNAHNPDYFIDLPDQLLKIM